MEIIDALSGITTAIITTVLLMERLRNTWVRGAQSIRRGQSRIFGRAFTLRIVAAREDLATLAPWGSPKSTHAAIDAMPEGCIAVVDAIGVTDAGIFGDIPFARMAKRVPLALEQEQLDTWITTEVETVHRYRACIHPMPKIPLVMKRQ